MIVQSWVDVLQQSFANLLNNVIGFIPSLVFAIIIFMVGWFIGGLLGRVIAQAIRSIKVDQALRSAGIGAQYFQTLFMGIVVALALAFGLSFGLGGQDAAARFIEKTRDQLHNK